MSTEIMTAERAALQRLIADLEYVHASDEYQAVWTMAQTHLGSYKGPSYTDAMQVARAALASPPDSLSAKRLARAYTLLCSVEPALIRSVEQSRTPEVRELHQLLLDETRKWIMQHRYPGALSEAAPPSEKVAP